MYENHGENIIRSFRFLALLCNDPTKKDDKEELLRKICRLEKLLHRCNTTDETLDKATEDVIRYFRDMDKDLGKEAYQIVRDAIKSSSNPMTMVEMALENINESISSINKNDNVQMDVGLSNPTSKAMVEINETLGKINKSLKDLLLTKTKSKTNKENK